MDDVFFLKRPDFVKPTLLYGLNPCEIGTGNVESLQSYLLSLSHAHRLSPSRLVEMLLSQIPSSVRPNSLRLGWEDKNGSAIVGCTETALGWIEILVAATGHPDVRLTTLRPLAHLVCGTSLLDSHCRVCLECIRSDIAVRKNSFGRLLWRLADVKCCPIHGLPLVEVKCSHGRRPSQGRYIRTAMFGVCGHCGSIGYRCHESTAPEISEEEKRFAMQCMRLIAAFPEFESLDARIPKQALRMYAESQVRGAAGLSNQACLPKSLLSRWFNEPEARLSLRAYFHLSEATGFSMVELMSGRLDPAAATVKRPVTRSRRQVRPVDTTLVRSRLRDTLRDGGSISRLHKELGVDRSTLRRIDPETYCRIVEKTKLNRTQALEARMLQIVSDTKEVLVRLLLQDLTPTLRNASILTGRQWLPSQRNSVALALFRIALGDKIALPTRAGRLLGQSSFAKIKAEAALIRDEMGSAPLVGQLQCA